MFRKSVQFKSYCRQLRPHLPFAVLLAFVLSAWSFFWGRHGVLELDAHSLQKAGDFFEVYEYWLLGPQAGHPRQSFGDLLLMLVQHLHMPLDFILRGVVEVLSLKDGLWAQRCLSIGFLLVTLVYTYRLADRLYSRETALVAAALLAFHPQILYVQSGYRMYPLFYCTAIMTVYYAVTYLDACLRRAIPAAGTTALLVLASSALVLTHFFGIIPVLVVLLFLLAMKFRRRISWRALLPLLPATVLWGTGFVVLLLELRQGTTLVEHTGTIPALSAANLLIFVRELTAGTLYTPFSWWLLLIIGGGFCLSFKAGKMQQQRLLWLPVIIVLFSLLLCILSGLFYRSIMQYRYFGFLLPLLIPAALHGWAIPGREFKVVVSAVAAAGLLALAILSFSRGVYQGIGDMVDVVQQRMQVVDKAESQLLLATTAGNLGHASFYQSQLPGLQIVSLPLNAGADLEERIVRKICGVSRLWFYRTAFGDAAELAALRLLHDRLTLVAEQKLASVYLYEFTADRDPCAELNTPVQQKEKQ